jgi:hypothetical protein
MPLPSTQLSKFVFFQTRQTFQLSTFFTVRDATPSYKSNLSVTTIKDVLSSNLQSAF